MGYRNYDPALRCKQQNFHCERRKEDNHPLCSRCLHEQEAAEKREARKEAAAERVTSMLKSLGINEPMDFILDLRFLLLDKEQWED